jgi:hypothetical protein
VFWIYELSTFLYQTQYEVNGGKCGICGDPWNQPSPRDNEEGGQFYAGIITRGYFTGQVKEILLSSYRLWMMVNLTIH